MPQKVDVGALRRDLRDFLDDGGLAPGTLNGYRIGWARFGRFCEEDVPGGTDPLTAGFEVFQALLTTDIPPGSLERLIGGVRHEYAKRGLTVPIDDPRYCGIWLDAMRGRRRIAARAREDRFPDEGKATPLTRTHALQMLAVEEPIDSGDRGYIAATLLMLDHGVGLTQASRMRLSDIVGSPRNEGGLTVYLRSTDRGHDEINGIVEILCDHTSRVRGVPWDCTACHLREHWIGLSDQGARPESYLFATGKAANPKRIRQWLAQRLHKMLQAFTAGNVQWTAAGDAITVRAGATDWTRAGARRALVLGLQRNTGHALVRAKCRISLAWTNGVRAASDLDEVIREDIRHDPALGFTVPLGATKPDRPGSRNSVGLALWEDWDDEQDFGTPGVGGPARFMTEYLAVRDAVVGTSGYLFCPVRAPSLWLSDPQHPDPYHSALADIKRLAAGAGLAELGYTTYSTRRGNAQQREAEGESLEQIQAALGHAHPDSTIRYLTGDGRSIPTEVLMKHMHGEAS